MHIEYIDLLYRTMHDIAESPRSAFGGLEGDISGVALEFDLHPLLQKVKRKRTIRTMVYNRRSEMILRLVKQFTGQDFGSKRLRVVWGPVLPQDKARQVQNEVSLVQASVHSRRWAMDELGIQDPDNEFNRWLEERQSILKMNKQMSVRSSDGRASEREPSG